MWSAEPPLLGSTIPDRTDSRLFNMGAMREILVK
jgi:hypothetical protein